MVGTRVKIQLAFVVVFLLGFAAGALSLAAYLRRMEAGRPAVWTGRFDRERFVKQLSEAVGLRPEQMGVLNGVLDEVREEFISLRKRLNPQFEEVRKRARTRIRSILDAEQQTRFDAFAKRWEEARQSEEQARSRPRNQERAP